MRNYSKRKSKYPHRIVGRISESKYSYLTGLLAQSNGLTMSELIRNILENRPIKLRYQNVALDQVMHQLALIYAEIHRIGVNVNQFAKEFHQSNQSIQKFLLGNKLIDHQQKILHEIEKLKPILSELQQQWLSE